MNKLFKIIVMLLPIFAFSQVADDELMIETQIIEFENYTGTYRYTESFLEIMGIGRILSNNLKKSKTNTGIYHNKYSVIHCSDEIDNGKYNADIISIDADAKVEHIRNVRTIIASYLAAQYGYTSKDAKTLAFFITIYNAVYRKDTVFFNTKYKDIVMQNITSENAGLSKKYYEWAGKSKIIIPLKSGKIKKPIVFELSEKKTIDEAKKTDDKSIKERKDLVKVQEKEVKEEKKIIETIIKTVDQERKEIITKEKELADKTEIIKTKEELLIKEEKELEQKKEVVTIISDPVEKEKITQEIIAKENTIAEVKESIEQEKVVVEQITQEVEEKKETVNENEKSIQEQQEKVTEKEKIIEEAKIDIIKDETLLKQETSPEKAEEDLEKKAENLAKQQIELDKKQQQLTLLESNLKVGQTDPKIMAGKFYYLKVIERLNDGHFNNEINIIEPISRTIIKTSSMTSICGKNYLVFPEGVVVIGHKGSHDSEHYLTLLDPETLEIKSIGDNNIFFRSFVQVHNNFMYAVLKSDTNYYLGKFDLTMKLIAKSDELILSDTFISFYDSFIYVNSNSKDILIFDNESLRKIDIVKP
ncbi:MAG: hypothetical protein A2015_07805 [Spirochaetes bacterium GWF1_31_7]|nr:MAG: hypothetical protein A2Y30_01900 [Spirochaetes bacterium GWE1_32_154]OHD46946.1 MAG: hypothetical protein A2015_07805 [Spirochaetes bacterium GWF1_31_7]OHD48724.1 MAG: hypothetical protein A2Y29_14035 [Spirochaetes bacterium GWE2_31_10]OHD82338.1 MAG: hypothetical protein A2355_11935 [Spirochaetes bacterium RIFOXYB1_FULL_32_8]HBD95547.1 hypothetical protein [Spirochaetia bacterium]